MMSTPTPIKIKNQTQSKLSVLKFYANKNLLLTGVTGFLGKVILWKLLEACQDIGKIYVLVRPRRGATAEQRLAQLLNKRPFIDFFTLDQLKVKVEAIEGDITLDDLGLSETDRKLLQQNVNVVIHNAASINLSATNKDNLRVNYYGTKSMLDLSDGMSNLQSFIYVSSAYSNCNYKDVDEAIMPLNVEYNRAVKNLESHMNGQDNSSLKTLLEGRPNTYTYTKALAEHLVSDRTGAYPSGIVRPSIIVSSYRKPYPGWIDNVNGLGGLICVTTTGLTRTSNYNYYARFDVVPVDYVANCIICAAKKVAEERQKQPIVFNMTAGLSDQITLGSVLEILKSNALRAPPTKIVRPLAGVPKQKRANAIVHRVTQILSELVFAYFVDLILSLLGYKTFLVRAMKRMHAATTAMDAFMQNEWNFTTNNVVSLSDSLSNEDKQTFAFDMRNMNWTELGEISYKGMRHFLLKDENTEESFALGRKRYRLATVVHYTINIILIVSFLYLASGTYRFVKFVIT